MNGQMDVIVESLLGDAERYLKELEESLAGKEVEYSLPFLVARLIIIKESLERLILKNSFSEMSSSITRRILEILENIPKDTFTDILSDVNAEDLKFRIEEFVSLVDEDKDQLEEEGVSLRDEGIEILMGRDGIGLLLAGFEKLEQKNLLSDDQKDLLNEKIKAIGNLDIDLRIHFQDLKPCKDFITNWRSILAPKEEFQRQYWWWYRGFNHPLAETLLAYCEGTVSNNKELEGHLVKCQECQREIDTFKQSIKFLKGLKGLEILRDTNHPSVEELIAYANDEVSEQEQEKIETHLPFCEDCTREIAMLASFDKSAFIREFSQFKGEWNSIVQEYLELQQRFAEGIISITWLIKALVWRQKIKFQALALPLAAEGAKPSEIEVEANGKKVRLKVDPQPEVEDNIFYFGLSVPEKYEGWTVEIWGMVEGIEQKMFTRKIERGGVAFKEKIEGLQLEGRATIDLEDLKIRLVKEG